MTITMQRNAMQRNALCTLIQHQRPVTHRALLNNLVRKGLIVVSPVGGQFATDDAFIALDYPIDSSAYTDEDGHLTHAGELYVANARRRREAHL